MRGRLITDESSLQIRAPNIRMKGHGVSSRSSRGEIDTLNRRGEQDGVTDCSRKTKVWMNMNVTNSAQDQIPGPWLRAERNDLLKFTLKIYQ